MAVALKLSDELVEDAKATAIGKLVLENPDMPVRLVQDTMLSLEEAKVGQVAPYQFD